jgi:RNA polymerase sigma-70 factor, ECF subfamily
MGEEGIWTQKERRGICEPAGGQLAAGASTNTFRRALPGAPQHQFPAFLRQFSRPLRLTHESINWAAPELAAERELAELMAEVDDWTRWLDGHGPTLLLLARQWAPSPSDAQDIVQEAFLGFWRTRQNVADPASYLYACLRRSAVDLYRRNQSRRRHEQGAAREEVSGGWFGDRADQDSRLASIETALQSLPPEQREVLTMKIWGRLKFKQIAAALGVSPYTAASRYRYGLEKLRSELRNESSNEDHIRKEVVS